MKRGIGNGHLFQDIYKEMNDLEKGNKCFIREGNFYGNMGYIRRKW